MLAVFMLIFALPSYGYEGLPEVVRIGLFYDGTALDEVKISSDTEIIVYDGETEIVRGYDITVKYAEEVVGVYINDECVYTPEGDKLLFVPTESNLKLNSKEYRGSVELMNIQSGKITVVNIVNLEEYLYGVVPLEMSTGFPIEALKAQAVCARTYAVNSMGRFASKGFDLTNTTLSQVYGGVSAEKEDCTQAVTETAGMVLTYDGRPAQVYYFSTSSGVTLNSQDVWSEALPYLQSVPDSWQYLITPDNKAWEVTYTAEEVTGRMKNLGYELGDVTSVEVTKTNEQGAVTELVVTGTEGSHTFKKEGCRNAFNLKSQTFTITAEGTEGGICVIGKDGKTTISGGYYAKDSESVSKLDNAKVLTAEGTEDITSKTVSSNYIISGSGWGHGIGMSQNGARGMAQSGFSYADILTHYFSGTQIQ